MGGKAGVDVQRVVAGYVTLVLEMRCCSTLRLQSKSAKTCGSFQIVKGDGQWVFAGPMQVDRRMFLVKALPGKAQALKESEGASIG